MGHYFFRLTLILAMLFWSVCEAKFSRGDQFQYANIDGSLTIQCAGRTKVVSCRDTFLDPWPYDIFIGSKNPNATSVELVSVVGNSKQDITVGYSGVAGKSAEVNLGVFSLFQKPLLKLGTNQIRYVLLSQNNTVLETNVFNVVVTRGNNRTCENRVITSPNPDDCDHPYSVCQMYFRNLNYCH